MDLRVRPNMNLHVYVWLWLPQKTGIYGSLRGYPDVWNEGVTQKGMDRGYGSGHDQGYGSPVAPGYGSGPYILSCSHMSINSNPQTVVELWETWKLW
jgi:hypothetical protein